MRLNKKVIALVLCAFVSVSTCACNDSLSNIEKNVAENSLSDTRIGQEIDLVDPSPFEVTDDNFKMEFTDLHITKDRILTLEAKFTALRSSDQMGDMKLSLPFLYLSPMDDDTNIKKAVDKNIFNLSIDEPNPFNVDDAKILKGESFSFNAALNLKGLYIDKLDNCRFNVTTPTGHFYSVIEFKNLKNAIENLDKQVPVK